MVKKRNRDPEVLAEAPILRADEHESGSDEVKCTPHLQTELIAYTHIGY
jgi:hypothetical protein